MEIISGGKLNISCPTAVTIGNFDGVHLGHQKLLGELTAQAKKHNAKSLVYTFSEHPVQILKGNLPALSGREEKIRLMEKAGVDILYFADFLSVKDLPPTEFVDEVLLKELRMQVAVIGENNRFGKMSSGDASLLCQLGEERGFPVYVVAFHKVDGVVCSSSAIRESLINGKIEQAEKLLGRPYSVSGTVVDGKHLGRTYGFPTINMMPPESSLLPKTGVYATNATVKGKTYPAITNVGETSFDEKKIFRIETHILDFNEDVYGEDAEITFLRYMRDIQPFASTEKLEDRLKKDREIRYHMREEK